MTTQELLDRLRERLVPQGTAPVVKLELMHYGFFDADSIQKAIDRFEQILVTHVALGEKANPLEALGIRLLLDSIYYEWEKK